MKTKNTKRNQDYYFYGSVFAVVIVILMGILQSNIPVEAINWRFLTNVIMSLIVVVAVAGIAVSVIDFASNKKNVHRIFTSLVILYLFISLVSAGFSILVGGIGFLG